jgi:hypothetical protein
MSVGQHIQDSVPGVVGTCIAGSFTVMGFMDVILPTLQALSLLAGICVASVTFVYYWRKVQHHKAVIAARPARRKQKARASK